MINFKKILVTLLVTFFVFQNYAAVIEAKKNNESPGFCDKIVKYTKCCPDGKTEITVAVHTITFYCATGKLKNEDIRYTFAECPKSSSNGVTLTNIDDQP